MPVPETVCREWSAYNGKCMPAQRRGRNVPAGGAKQNTSNRYLCGGALRTGHGSPVFNQMDPCKVKPAP
jgi:hypothetical protein